jgi:DNA ligase D-like protein (predicted 3'-phosphoesterase)
VTDAGQPRFVVQEHFARTHHYDFRLEKEGVLKSWVLRKPIPQSAGVRRLAIQVEDHDLAFGDFEGEILRGEYGAGKIRIWDRGTFLASRWDDDRISFRISGRKLSGSYTLIRFRRAGKNRWLLMKHKE